MNNNEERRKLMEVSIDMFRMGIWMRQITDYISWMVLDQNKQVGKSILIPRFKRCQLCNHWILFKPWTKTFTSGIVHKGKMRGKYKWYHSDCFQHRLGLSYDPGDMQNE